MCHRQYKKKKALFIIRPGTQQIKPVPEKIQALSSASNDGIEHNRFPLKDLPKSTTNRECCQSYRERKSRPFPINLQENGLF